MCIIDRKIKTLTEIQINSNILLIEYPLSHLLTNSSHDPSPRMASTATHPHSTHFATDSVGE